MFPLLLKEYNFAVGKWMYITRLLSLHCEDLPHIHNANVGYCTGGGQRTNKFSQDIKALYKSEG